MGTVKIDINKHKQLFEIGSKTYELELRDDNLKDYLVKIKDIADGSKKPEEVDLTKDPEKAFSHLEEQNAEFIKICFGDGAYEEIFEEVGRSSYVMVQVVENVVTEVERIIVEMDAKRKSSKKADYYTKPKVN